MKAPNWQQAVVLGVLIGMIGIYGLFMIGVAKIEIPETDLRPRVSGHRPILRTNILATATILVFTNDTRGQDLLLRLERLERRLDEEQARRQMVPQWPKWQQLPLYTNQAIPMPQLWFTNKDASIKMDVRLAEGWIFWDADRYVKRVYPDGTNLAPDLYFDSNGRVQRRTNAPAAGGGR